MPRIPVYEQRTTPSGMGASASARGVQVLSPMQGNALGQGIQQIATAMETREKKDAQAWFDQSASESQLKMYEYMNEAKQTAQAGAKGFYPAFMKKHDEYFMELEQNAPDDYARELVRRQKAQSQVQFGKHALEFESLEGMRYRQEQTINAVDMDAKALDVMPLDDVDGQVQSQLAKWEQRLSEEDYEPSVKAKMLAGIKDKLLSAATKRIIRKDAEGYLNKVRPQKAGVDSFLNLTMEVEGGYVASDGASKAPALFGINRKSYPKEFDEVNAMYQAGDKAGAEAKAREFYKAEIWDKNDLGSLDPAAATVVADGMVNHWHGFAQKLRQKAQDGATADELLQMRQDEYDRLVKSNPAKYENSYEGWMNRLDKVEAAAGAPSNDPLFNMMTSEQQQSALSVAEKQFKKELAEAEELKSQQLARFDADFAIGIARNELSYPDIESAYNKGLITPEQKKKYTLQLDKAAKDLEDDTNGAMKVQAALQGKLYLDPRNNVDRKAADKHFTQSMQQIPEGMEPLDYAVSLTEKYGMIPETLKGQLRGQLRSGKPDDILAASEMMERFRVLNPKMLDDFDKKDIQVANHIRSLVDVGFSPADAVRRAAEDIKMTPEVKKQREESLKKEMLNLEGEAKRLINAKFSAWYDFTTPEAPSAMQGDFNAIMREEYMQFGNIETAKKTAMDTIGRVWGTTSIGTSADGSSGNRWMRNAPEKFYASGEGGIDESEWMQEQLVEDVNSVPSFEPIDADRLMVIAAKEKSPDGRPLYNVFSRSENGLITQIYSDNGKPLLWHPDWNQSKERKRLIRRAREARE
jgi:hypothetical protein